MSRTSFSSTVFLDSDVASAPLSPSEGMVNHSLCHIEQQDPAIESFHQQLCVPQSWTDISNHPLKKIRLCHFIHYPSGNGQPVVISHCIIVHEDFTWSLYVHNHEIELPNCKALRCTPQILTPHSLQSLLSQIESLHVCVGQPDSHFVSMLKTKKGGKVLSSKGQYKAYVDQYTSQSQQVKVTVRTESCEMLVESQKCGPCKAYRNVL